MLNDIVTTDGRQVEVIDAGLHNRNEGPTFFNAKIRIGATLWVGNVMIHAKCSEWYVNGHATDKRYNNVILLVCNEADAFVQNSLGETIRVTCQAVPEKTRMNYQSLVGNTSAVPPCAGIVPSCSSLMIHAWLAAMQTERLEEKTEAIRKRAEACGSWEKAHFVTMARAFGFGHDSEVYENWAKSIPFEAVQRYRDDLFQIEAIFLGQAGLLELDTIPEKYQEKALKEGYFQKLRNEYLYLAHKLSMKPIDGKAWNTSGLLPQSYPHVRLSQLANIFYQRKADLGQITEAKDSGEVRKLMATHVTPAWQNHYMFGVLESKQSEKNLSAASVNSLMINAVIPMLFAYGRHKSREILCDRAFDFLETLKAEDNAITKTWKMAGIPAKTAGDSQALIQMKHRYCDKKDCLRCRLGYEYIRKAE